MNTIFELLPQNKVLKIGGCEMILITWLTIQGDKPKLVDLGSGDGRIVIEAAKKGYEAVGYEINPWLVLYSRHLAKKQGVADSCKFVLILLMIKIDSVGIGWFLGSRFVANLRNYDIRSRHCNGKIKNQNRYWNACWQLCS